MDQRSPAILISLRDISASLEERAQALDNAQACSRHECDQHAQTRSSNCQEGAPALLHWPRSRRRAAVVFDPSRHKTVLQRCRSTSTLRVLVHTAALLNF
jgi:hypothetical protein